MSDYRPVNRRIEKIPGVSRTKRRKRPTCRGRHVLRSLTCCKGIGRCRWRPKPRKCSPSPPRSSVTRVTQGVFNTTAYFQDVMTELLAGLNCKVWVDDIVWWGTDADNLLNPLDKILSRLEEADMFAAAHKCLLFYIEIT